MLLYISAQAPYTWVTYHSELGSEIGRGQVDSLDDLNFDQQVDQVYLVAKGSTVASHTVTVPGSSAKVALEALPYVLEEELTDDIEDLHFALQDWQANDSSQVLVINDELMQSWLAEFRDLGYEVADIIPEYLLLPQHPATQVTLAQTQTGEYLIRSGDYSGNLVDASLLELWWEMNDEHQAIAVNDETMVQDRQENGWDQVQYWDIGDDFPEWIANGGGQLHSSPCLLQGKYDDTQIKQDRIDYKIAAYLLLAGIGIYFGSILLNYAYLGFKSASLDSQAQEIYETSFPEFAEQESDNVVFEMRKALSALRSGNYRVDDFLPIFQVVASQIKASPQTTVINIVFEDDVLNAEVSVNDFAALETLVQNLANTTKDYASVISKEAVAQDNRVKGIVEVTLIQG